MLVQVAEDIWVSPADVIGLHETWYEGSKMWLTMIYTRGGSKDYAINEARAKDIADILNRAGGASLAPRPTGASLHKRPLVDEERPHPMSTRPMMDEHRGAHQPGDI